MKERPIIFSGDMVRAIFDGRKTQTRRIVKPTRDRSGSGCHLAPCEIAGEVNSGDYSLSPYGKPGDRLWVRETWSGDYYYRDTPPSQRKQDVSDPRGPTVHYPTDVWYWADGNPEYGDWELPRPSIHMPRYASRITLEITDVRVERLQDISEEDATSEGIIFTDHGKDAYRQQLPGWHWGNGYKSAGNCLRSARFAFANLWNKINGEYAWDDNPFVWVVSFKPVQEVGE